MIQRNLNELRLDIQKQIGFRINTISELKTSLEVDKHSTNFLELQDALSDIYKRELELTLYIYGSTGLVFVIG